ncbi:uncharacterized protein LOC110849954 isoform X2 [Folsomia candida]|nr:uncharacterized protein LOC110849954 isoform X2 [Folsomia candida]
MELAMTNILILKAIFAQLPIQELKISRAVCRLWNEVGFKELKDRVILSIGKICTFTDPLLINAKLTKYIGIRMESNRSCHEECSTGMNLIQLPPNVQQVVEEVRIQTSAEYLAAIIEYINNCAFPILDYISLKISGCNAYRLDLTSHQNRRTALLIKSIITQYPSTLLPTFLENCTNLEVLQFEKNTPPSLVKCSNLKFLSYSGVPVDMSVINRMLEQVGGSLVELELRNKLFSMNQRLTRTQFNPPRMPNLTTLTVFAAELYQLENVLSTKLLPRLKHLSLKPSTGSTFAVDNFLQNLYEFHNGIESLSYEASTQADVRQAVILFPNVKNIEVRFSSGAATNREMLEQYRNWDIQRAKVTFITMISSIQEMVVFLEAMSTWRGRKTLSLFSAPVVTFEKSGIDSSRTARRSFAGTFLFTEFGEMAKSAFLFCKSFQAVELFDFGTSDVVRREMEEFIAIEKLPIKFKSTS